MKKNLLMIIALLCVVVQTARAQWSGSGTEADPYLITSKADWSTLCKNVNKSGLTYRGKYFKLMADLSGLEYDLCVGDGDYNFEGNFDGNNHTLSIWNFYGNGYWAWAPFSQVKDATIKRLHVTGKLEHAAGGDAYHGGIVGYARGYTTLIACHSSVELKLWDDYNSTSADAESGGLVGYVDNSDGPASLTMVNCLFDGKISCDHAYAVGGFIGRANSGSFVTLVNCLFDPKSTTIHECYGHSTFLALNADGKEKHLCKHYVKKNCFRKKKFGKAEGEDASDWSNSQLLARLGRGWHEVNGKVVPDLTLDFYPLTGEGTEGSPYLISSSEDWEKMTYNISIGANYFGKFFKQTQDITLTETFSNGVPVTMIGVGQGISFRGTYDGDGHTLTLDYTDNNNGDYCGPFRFINDATIKNLHVTGKIVKNTGKNAGSLVGQAWGTNTIVNCRSSVDIQVNTDGDCSSGGFIGDLRGGTTTLEGCLFNGKLRGPNGAASRSTKWGGFIGWVADGRKAIIQSCVFDPAEINITKTSDCRTFARRDDDDDLTLTGDYYFQTLGSSQGGQALTVQSDEHVEMSPDYTIDYITHYDISGIRSYFYGSAIEYRDKLYSAIGHRVSLQLSQVGETPAGSAPNSFIATPGKLRRLSMNDYPQRYYFTMPGANVLITLAPADWTGDGSEANPYLIYNAEQWALLVNRVNNGENVGYNGKFFKLMADITVSEAHSSGNSAQMIGISTGGDNTKFRGTFDGNGQTITLDIIDTSEDDYCAPFRYLKDGTVKNLHVDGTIVKTQKKNAGGIVGKAEGINTISNCWSSVDIQFNKDGDVSSGGIIGELRAGGTTTLTDCLFDGKLQGKTAYKWGGFVGWVADGNKIKFNNCLFNPSLIDIDTDDSDDNSRTFARRDNSNDVTLTNCYYKTLIKDAQGATNAGSYSNVKLRSSLGSGWRILEGKVVPFMGFYDFAGKGTQVAPYLISSATDWEGLARNVALGVTYNGTYFQQTADISVNTMVGNDENYFMGYYDGGGNKLTFDYSAAADEDYCAPFRYVSDATIENLHVAGTITTDASYAAGLVAYAGGMNSTDIRNCRSSVAIILNSSDSQKAGGFVAKNTFLTTITGCLFDGELRFYEGAEPDYCGGFAACPENEVQINDCLFAPSVVSGSFSDCGTFAYVPEGHKDWLEVNNSYYTRTLGEAQGKQRRTIIAGTDIDIENVGIGIVTEYAVSGITGYFPGIVYDGNLLAGSGDNMVLNLSYNMEAAYKGYTIGYKADKAELSGSDNPYTMTMPDADVTISVSLTGKEWEGTGTENDPYLIYNNDQLDKLADFVNTGTSDYSGKYFKVMDYIVYPVPQNLSSQYDPIGSSDHAFNGHFDGQDFSISGIQSMGSVYNGLFGHLGSAAVVKNVALQDAVIGNGIMSGAIAGYNEGTITNCYATATIESDGGVFQEMPLHGGIVGNNTGTVSNCTFAGTVGATTNAGAIAGQNSGTLAYNYYGTCTVNGVANATGVGCGIGDAKEDEGAVPALRNDADNSNAIALMATASDLLGIFRVSLTGRTLYKDGDWNTICLPFEVLLDGSTLEGATVMELDTEGTYDTDKQTGYDAETGTLSLYFKEATAIEAGKPYLVKWETPDIPLTNPVFSSTSFSNVKTDVESADGKVQFRGNYSPVELEAGDKSSLYLGADNKLYWPSKARTINAFRGYFHVELGTSAGVREFVLNFDGETATGVESVQGSRFKLQDTDDDAWYTLDGRKLNDKPTQKGIYIHNGKKVVVK